jgi:Kazal-type serine protease inhibitor-like protein
MKSRVVPFAILLAGATGMACADYRELLGSGAELTTTPCDVCPSDAVPRLACQKGQAPHCFRRTDGTCGWGNVCSDLTPDPVTCGGLAGTTCAPGKFCNFPVGAQCGAADQTGTCTAIPEACTLQYTPLCGCDGKTYGNTCEAASAGVSIAKAGECAPSSGPKTCGGIAGLACAKGEYCNYPIEAQCGAADQTGTCAPIPEACTLQYTPLCGCDGKTYGNTCEAASAGVSVNGTGACP